MEIWRGRILWRVYVHPHTHPQTQLKKSGIAHTHTHTQSMRGFPVKTGTGSGNTHGDGFICHLYLHSSVKSMKQVKYSNSSMEHVKSSSSSKFEEEAHVIQRLDIAKRDLQ